MTDKLTDTIKSGFDFSNAMQLASTFPPSVKGTLLNSTNGLPLPNMSVVMHSARTALTKESDVRQPEGLIVGEAVTDKAGSFDISFSQTREAQEELLLLTQFPGSAFVLSVAQPGKKDPLTVSKPYPIRSGGNTVALTIELAGEEIPASMWDTVGSRLEEARITQIHEIASLLTSTSPSQQLFADISQGQRQTLLVELEEAFLDPSGLLRKFAPVPSFHESKAPGTMEQYQITLKNYFYEPGVEQAFNELLSKMHRYNDLSDVPWILDLNVLRKGGPLAALKIFQDLASNLDTYPTLETEEERSVDEDAFIGYRDYLRAIWLSLIHSAGRYDDLDSYPSPEEIRERDFVIPLRNLRQRLHQNFETIDITPAPANQTVIRILREILTARSGAEYGFGIDLTTIQPQGTRSNREYLDYLISLTTIPEAELKTRYRISFDRDDRALSSEVQENIKTLQDFFSDAFQSPPEPYPLIPEMFRGRAPFYLEYEEWQRRRRPFFAENLYPIRNLTNIVIEPETVVALRALPRPGFTRDTRSPEDDVRDWQWFVDFLGLVSEVEKGNRAFRVNEFLIARNHYETCQELLENLLQALQGRVFQMTDNQVYSLSDELRAELVDIQRLRLRDIHDLEGFIHHLTVEYAVPANRDFWSRATNEPLQVFWWNIYRSRSELHAMALYVATIVLPTCLGDTALAMGDYASAVKQYGRVTRFLLARGPETLFTDGYPYTVIEGTGVRPIMFHEGSLPYSADLWEDAAEHYPPFAEPDLSTGLRSPTAVPIAEQLARLVLNSFQVHLMFKRLARLRQGTAMLEWADALYRTNSPASISRAREIYKGVMWLHGLKPPILPRWAATFPNLPLDLSDTQGNPALASQLARATKGFSQIESGLNYFGYANNHVPALRYRILKDAADNLATLAKSAEQDLLTYTRELEAALVEDMRTANLLHKASLQESVADEQAALAAYQVQQAQNQVTAVDAAIVAKQREIDDHESFFAQWADFFTGIGSALGGLPAGLTGAATSGVTGETLTSSVLTVGAGAGITAGFALFVYAGYVSMDGMVNAGNRRHSELQNLRESARPAAEELVRVRTREVTVANLNRRIAEADATLARDLIDFQANRLLTVELWVNLMTLMRRMLRRYLDMGARTAWLAERSLGYEQNRDLHLVGFDYFPIAYHGISGADLLQADLAHLESIRLEGINELIPIRHTFSLASDFPLQFGQLITTGRCTLMTEIAPLQLAYPGTYDHRIMAITVHASNVNDMTPIRGLLRNEGVSLIAREDNTSLVLMRPPDALPVSEFRWEFDSLAFGLPNEALSAFEGSGIETFWTLELPPAANPSGVRSVIDILLTFDVRARYSPALYQTQLASASTSTHRMVLVSALRFNRLAVENLRGPATRIQIDFDLNAVPLPPGETNRRIDNLALFVASERRLRFTATFTSTTPAIGVDVTFESNLAISNASPLTSSGTTTLPAPLNAFIGIQVNQVFRLVIDKAANPGVDFGTAMDVVLALSYDAVLS